MLHRRIAVLSLLLLSACGESGTPAADAGGLTDARADATPLPVGEWVPLVTAAWSFAAGDEGYICATRTLDQDMYIGAIRPINSTGTHHTTVSLVSGGGPDNPGSPCGPSFGDLYASGVGTEALVLPEGVGLVVPAGQRVSLNLHLFNTGEATLTGTSGIEVMLLDPAKVQHPASISFHGPADFEIPDDGQPYSASSTSTLPAGKTLIAIFPHMHQLGTHFRSEIVRGTGSVVLWDEDYQFESQEFALITPVPVLGGDQVTTTCTWVNTTEAPVRWGDSSKAEMCFSILMSY